MKFTVAIIGLGKIGMAYDRHLSETAYVLTHARAFRQHQGFELIAGVDPNTSVCQEFQKFFDVDTYPTPKEMLTAVRPDVIVISNPTTEHLLTLQTILTCYSPQAILCEKPLSTNLADSKKMVDLCHERGIPLFVNFIRRGDLGIQEVRKRISSNLISPPYKTIVWYSKGLMHNGSHFLDLLTFFFGNPQSSSIVSVGETFGKEDAEPDVRFQFHEASAIFCAAKEENFSHYTVEIIATNGRLRIEKNGEIHWQNAAPHPTLKNHNQLSAKWETIPNTMDLYQARIADEFYGALCGKNHNLCDGNQALATQKSISEIISSLIDTRG